LDEATRQALDTAFIGKTYLTKVYMGSRYSLDYTNNSVEGRSTTGVFIDQSLNYWYETDASFFGAGTSGREFTLEQLQVIDRDLDFDTFGQGITSGQLVVIKEISDKSDQVIFKVRTVRRHAVTKKYGFNTDSRAKSRESQIHCVFGKEGMRNLDQMALNQMLDHLLAPAPLLTTDARKSAFILSNYLQTALEDLVEITGYSRENILKIYYSHILSQSQLATNVQEELVDVLVTNHADWYQDLGIRLQSISVDGRSLILDCAIQEISNSVIYHSLELRAGLLFFDGAALLAKPFGNALVFIPAEDLDSSLQQLIVKFSYLYFDKQGQRFPETIAYTIAAEDLQQFVKSAISDQEFADRSEILMGTIPVKISLSALKAVENISQGGSTTWKMVDLELRDWGYEEDKDEGIIIFDGEVRNTGTWIARDVEITVEGYGKYGFRVRSESTTLSGLLKPGETKTFTIKMNTENVKRFGKPVIEWKEVE